jgi:spermidine synthase
MIVPAWKRLASYLVDMPVEKASTSLNPSLELCLRQGRYYLSTPNAVYSYEDLYDNFSKTFKRLNFTSIPGNDVLLLGFGMASIPIILEKIHRKNYRYTGVEADAVIAGWAEIYILPNLRSEVEIHLEDAISFVHDCRRQFGLVIVDLFLDEIVPDAAETAGFLKNLQSLLLPGGLLLYNRLADTPAFLEKTNRFYETTFKSAFPEAVFFDLGTNRMLLNRPA